MLNLSLASYTLYLVTFHKGSRINTQINEKENNCLKYIYNIWKTYTVHFIFINISTSPYLCQCNVVNCYKMDSLWWNLQIKCTIFNWHASLSSFLMHNLVFKLTEMNQYHRMNTNKNKNNKIIHAQLKTGLLLWGVVIISYPKWE